MYAPASTAPTAPTPALRTLAAGGLSSYPGSTARPDVVHWLTLPRMACASQHMAPSIHSARNNCLLRLRLLRHTSIRQPTLCAPLPLSRPGFYCLLLSSASEENQPRLLYQHSIIHSGPHSLRRWDLVPPRKPATTPKKSTTTVRDNKRRRQGPRPTTACGALLCFALSSGCFACLDTKYWYLCLLT